MARRSILFLVGVLATLAFSPPAAWAVGGATNELPEQEKPGQFPIGAMVILDNAVGAGTFVSQKFERRPLYAATLTFLPSWRATDQLTVRGRLDIGKEFVSNASSETTKDHEVTLADAMLSVLYGSFYRVPADVPVVGGLNFGGMFDLILPTSKQSQFRTLVMGLRPVVIISYPIGPVDLAYQFRFTKNFNRYTSPVVSASDTAPVALARVRGNEEVSADLIALGGNNVEFSVANRLTVQWNIGKGFGFEDRELSLMVDYMVSNAWTYRSYPSDELMADDAVSGRGQRDLELGTVELSVKAIDHLYLALGVQSYQPPQTSDNKGFRAPFFNFWDLANNYTTVYFDVIGVF